MKLTNDQFRRFQQVFLDAFYDYDDLALMVRVVLGENLHEIVETDALERVVFQLIEWSDRHDNVVELIRGAHDYRPGNFELQVLVQEIEQWDTLLPPDLPTATPPAADQLDAQSDPPTPITPPRPSLPPSATPIEEAPSVQLSPLERQLLRIALAYYEQDVLTSGQGDGIPKVIVVHKFGAGFSGAVVLLIDPGSGRAPIVAKIGPFGDLQQEYAAYQHLIRLAAPNIAASVLGPPWPDRNGSGLGILLYIYGSAPRRLPHSLLDYYRQAGGAATSTVLRNLLLEQGSELWGNTRRERFWLVQEYDRLLPVHLEVSRAEQDAPDIAFEAGQVDDSALRTLTPGALVRLNGFTLVKFVNAPARGNQAAVTRMLLQAPPPPGQVSGDLRILLIQPAPAPVGPGETIAQLDVRVDATRQGRLIEIAQEIIPGFAADAAFLPVQTEMLPNPLLGLDALLDSRAEANWSTIHGDLNLQNILVDPPSGYARLIDFAETRPGPTLFDLHRLIVQIITRLLTGAVAANPALGPESLAYLMHELHNSQRAAESPVPALQDVYVVLRTLWEISDRYLDQHDGWAFFYNGLRIALLGALRFAELNSAARHLVLVGAAKAAELAQTAIFNGAEKPPAPGVAPYKGLAPFEPSDAAIFCGRAALTERLMAHLAQGRFLVLVGASGSGKSSLARAGLMPAFLRRPADGEPQAAHRAIVLTPTDQPLLRLAQALTGAEQGEATTQLANAMRGAPDGLHRYIQEHMMRDESAADVAERRLLLLVDQMEELFTLCREAAERAAFVDNLLTAAAAEAVQQDADEQQSPVDGVRTLVVCTLRADFYARFLGFEQLRGRLETNQIIVPAMTVGEMREAIIGPAQRPESAWYFESGLVDQMIGDVGAEPGALPLLSHALLETWRRRSGRTLTLAGYQSAGRVQGALAQTAEALYTKLPPAEQELTRRIFLALTELGEGAADTRRRVARGDLVRGDKADQVAGLLERLAQRRLVTLSQAYVEVAHEALIRRWPRLQNWLEEDREGLRIERKLSLAAEEWDESGKKPELLYEDFRLGQAQQLLQNNREWFSELAVEFVAASADRLREIEKAQRRRAQKQSAMLTTILLLAVPTLFVLANLFMFVRRQYSQWQLTGFPSDAATTIVIAPRLDGITEPKICVGSADIGIGCSNDLENWNIVQIGFPTTKPAILNDREKWWWHFTGSTWSTKIHGIDALAFDQTDSQRLYAIVYASGLYTSTDGGAHWSFAQKASESSPTADVRKLIVVGKTLFLLRNSVISNLEDQSFFVDPNQAGSLHISPDGGNSWQMFGGPATNLGVIDDFHVLFTPEGVPETVFVSSKQRLLVGHVRNGWEFQEKKSLPDDMDIVHLGSWNDKLYLAAYDSRQGSSKVLAYQLQGDLLTDEVESAPLHGKPLDIAVSPADGLVWVLLQTGQIISVDPIDGRLTDRGSYPGWFWSFSYDLAFFPKGDGTYMPLLGHNDGVLKFRD
ncbi:MAG: effector-associated domain EAD1-containing protein [Caldilineaceae bacterium]